MTYMTLKGWTVDIEKHRENVVNMDETRPEIDEISVHHGHPCLPEALRSFFRVDVQALTAVLFPKR